MWHNIYSFTNKTSCLLPSFDNCKLNCYKHSHADFCVHVTFHTMCSCVRNSPTIFQAAVLYCFPTVNEWEFLLLYIFTIVVAIIISINFSHSNKCIVVSCCFNLQLHNDKWYSLNMPIYLLCWSVLLFYSIFNWVIYFLTIKFEEFFIFFG